MQDLFLLFNPFSIITSTVGSVITLAHLVLWIIAAFSIVKSNRETIDKAIWIAAIFFLPVIGLIGYYFFAGKS